MGKQAHAVLERGAADADPDTRREVAVALSLVAVRDPATALLAALAKDKDHLVREAALLTIGELRDQRLLPPVEDGLNDNIPEVAFAAARTMYRLKQPEGKQFLIAVVEKETDAQSGFLRAKMRDVARRMKRPKSAILFVARQGAGFLPVPGLGEGFSAMGSLVADDEFSARATALLMLAPERSPEVRRSIEAAFNDTEWSMRAAAVQIAASQNERQWRSRMVPLFEDTSKKVRYRAAASYLRLNYAPARAGRTK
jgi:HEAT repeat protein